MVIIWKKNPHETTILSVNFFFSLFHLENSQFPLHFETVISIHMTKRHSASKHCVRSRVSQLSNSWRFDIAYVLQHTIFVHV